MNSLDVKKHATSSSSSSSLSDPHHQMFDDIPLFNDRGDNEIAKAQRDIHESVLRRESFLDEICDSFADKKSAFSHSNTATTTLTKIKKLELAGSPAFVNGTTAAPNNQTKATGYAHYNGKSNGNPKSIDTKKKTELLAALKHIDNGSFEN